jgi:hypothetical protein
VRSCEGMVLCYRSQISSLETQAGDVIDGVAYPIDMCAHVQVGTRSVLRFELAKRAGKESTCPRAYVSNSNAYQLPQAGAGSLTHILSSTWSLRSHIQMNRVATMLTAQMAVHCHEWPAGSNPGSLQYLAALALANLTTSLLDLTTPAACETRWMATSCSNATCFSASNNGTSPHTEHER